MLKVCYIAPSSLHTHQNITLTVKKKIHRTSRQEMILKVMAIFNVYVIG